MEITRKILLDLGFSDSDTISDMFFPRLERRENNPESAIIIKKDYSDSSFSEITWEVTCYRCNNDGSKEKSIVANGINSMDELKQCTDLCGIIL